MYIYAASGGATDGQHWRQGNEQGALCVYAKCACQ